MRAHWCQSWGREPDEAPWRTLWVLGEKCLGDIVGQGQGQGWRSGLLASAPRRFRPRVLVIWVLSLSEDSVEVRSLLGILEKDGN